ncbi:MAG: SEFIR domain-containing protein, partial [Terrimicrobiaceae bacterium]
DNAQRLATGAHPHHPLDASSVGVAAVSIAPLPARVELCQKVSTGRMPKVFLSYRHENSRHRDRVRQLALRLRDEGSKGGLKIVLDQLANEEEFHRGGPPEGWGRWSIREADEADRLLIVASEGWFRCFRGQEKAGVGLGSAAEAGVIQQRLYDSAGKNYDMRVVFFESSDVEDIPRELRGYHRFHATEDFADLVAWLSSSSSSPRAAAETLRQFGILPRPEISRSPRKVILATFGATGHANAPIDAALGGIQKDLQARGVEVEVDDLLSVSQRFPLFNLRRFEYRALIVLIGSDLGVEPTKEAIARFRKDLQNGGPPMYCFNFSIFPLHEAANWTTAVRTVDDLLEHVRRDVLI